MKTIIILTCLCAMVASVPVVRRIRRAPAEFPSFIQVEASNPVQAVRRARQLFDLNIDIYNNNGYGYFDNGYGRYGGYGGYGGFGGSRCFGCGYGGFF